VYLLVPYSYKDVVRVVIRGGGICSCRSSMGPHHYVHDQPRYTLPWIHKSTIKDHPQTAAHRKDLEGAGDLSTASEFKFRHASKKARSFFVKMLLLGSSARCGVFGARVAKSIGSTTPQYQGAKSVSGDEQVSSALLTTSVEGCRAALGMLAYHFGCAGTALKELLQ
jgi:hypothetical protein